MPKSVKPLPVVLSVEEVKSVLVQPDTNTARGLMLKAMLELLYSTGIRRSECCDLNVGDLSISRGTIQIREGKGGYDRLLPVGERALTWLQRYLLEVRPSLVLDVQEQALFLNTSGERYRSTTLGEQVKGTMKEASLKVQGSCHLLRHAMATHMLENGADLRFIQAMLGHSNLNTTEVYTHVSIRQLQQVHADTHPARLES